MARNRSAPANRLYPDSHFHWRRKAYIYNAIPLLEKDIYSPLKNLSFFMSAKVEGDTVVWNEDVDIAPKHLYEQSAPAGGVL